MIKRVEDDLLADKCDELLTKLIHDESKYNNFVKEDFKVNNYFKNMIKNDDNILLCYYEDNKVIGYIFLKYQNSDDGNGYLIDGIYIEKDYRQRGIGKKLISGSMKILGKKDIDFIDINVMHENTIARKIYKSFGFNDFKITMGKNINN